MTRALAFILAGIAVTGFLSLPYQFAEKWITKHTLQQPAQTCQPARIRT